MSVCIAQGNATAVPPRANCTGKRRNCYAMCKVTVYADAPDVAEVSFSGNHGAGNVTDPSLHRAPHEGKRRRLEEDSSDHGQVCILQSKTKIQLFTKFVTFSLNKCCNTYRILRKYFST